MKSSFREFIRRNFTTIFLSFTLLISFPFAFWVRYYYIEKEKNKVYNNIQTTVNQINNNLETNYQKMFYLSEVLLSQINNPRAFYDLNSTFKTVLSTETSINKVFVVLAKGNQLFDEQLYKIYDSLGQLNITWNKSYENIVYLDSINTENNIYFFEKLKSNPRIEVQKIVVSNHVKNINVSKLIVFPLFEGNAFIGVFGFELNTNYFESILLKNNIAKNSFFVDENGQILYNQGKLNYLGNPFTNILRDAFQNKETDIVQQKSFYSVEKKSVLFYSVFNNYYGNSWGVGVFVSKSSIYQKANLYFILIVSVLIVSVFVLLTLYFNIIDKTSNQIKEIVNISEQLQKGNLNQEVFLETKINDIEQIVKNLEQIKRKFLKLTDIHNQIKLQKEKIHLEPTGHQDIIAISINEAIDAISERQKMRLETMEKQKRIEWINDGLNTLHDAARVTEFANLNDLIDTINKTITIYSNAFLSTIYIIEQENEKNRLKSISTFGVEEKYAFEKYIDYGEGIVGTVAMERKVQYFRVIPDDYKTIITGLGDMKPKSILLQPLEYENEFFGIIEIAFLRYLDDYEIEYFKKVSSEIALSIKNILNNIAKEKLVEQLKNQTEEIEKAQKQLQDKVKELQTKEREASERESIMRSTYNAINNTLITIEYTTKGILLNANEKYLKASGYTLDEIRGINVLDLVKTERQELEDIIKRVSEGESVEKLVKRFTKFGEEKWFYSTYTPYFDTNGNITKIIYFAFDLTEMKKNLTKLEKEISILRKQVKILREKL